MCVCVRARAALPRPPAFPLSLPFARALSVTRPLALAHPGTRPVRTGSATRRAGRDAALAGARACSGLPQQSPVPAAARGARPQSRRRCALPPRSRAYASPLTSLALVYGQAPLWQTPQVQVAGQTRPRRSTVRLTALSPLPPISSYKPESPCAEQVGARSSPQIATAPRSSPAGPPPRWASAGAGTRAPSRRSTTPSRRIGTSSQTYGSVLTVILHINGVPFCWTQRAAGCWGDSGQRSA